MDVMAAMESAINLFGGAFSATKNAAESIALLKKTFASKRSSPDNTEVIGLVNALASDVTTANLKNAELSQELRSLSDVLRKEDQFERQLARYELVRTGQADFVFRLREELWDDEPRHHVCPTCLRRDRLFMILRRTGQYKTCPIDSTHIFNFGPPRTILVTEDD